MSCALSASCYTHYYVQATALYARLVCYFITNSFMHPLEQQLKGGPSACKSQLFEP